MNYFQKGVTKRVKTMFRIHQSSTPELNLRKERIKQRMVLKGKPVCNCVGCYKEPWTNETHSSLCLEHHEAMIEWSLEQQAQFYEGHRYDSI